MYLTYAYLNLKLTCRPFFKINVNGIDVICLYDSGADMPVTFRDHIGYFKGARQIGFQRLGGFGGSGENCPVFIVSKFELCDPYGCSLCFTNMPFAVSSRRDIYAEMILPAGMFKQCEVSLSPVKDVIRINSMQKCYHIGYDVGSGVVTAYTMR